MFRRSHFLVLDPTLPLPSTLSPMPMTTLLRRLFLAGVERSGIVLPELGAEQADLASVSTSDCGLRREATEAAAYSRLL